MHSQSHIVEAVATRLREWCQATGNAFMAAGTPVGLDDQAFSEIARDCGISESDLRMMMRAGEHGADEMIILMKALNIDPAGIEAAEPAAFRQMQANCTRCDGKARCRQALLAEHPFEEVAGFCANAPDFESMLKRPELQA